MRFLVILQDVIPSTTQIVHCLRRGQFIGQEVPRVLHVQEFSTSDAGSLVFKQPLLLK